MPISLYAASVPVFSHYLERLSALLDKAEAHVRTTGMDAEVLLQARLHADMAPFIRQVRIAAGFALRACAPLAGVEIPKFEDSERSFGDLKGRIARTQAFLDTLTPERIDGQEARDITTVAGLATLRFSGQDYLLRYALPNFYFHLTSAYAILRHHGVAIGKRDFDGYHLYENAR